MIATGTPRHQEVSGWGTPAAIALAGWQRSSPPSTVRSPVDVPPRHMYRCSLARGRFRHGRIQTIPSGCRPDALGLALELQGGSTHAPPQKKFRMHSLPSWPQSNGRPRPLLVPLCDQTPDTGSASAKRGKVREHQKSCSVLVLAACTRRMRFSSNCAIRARQLCGAAHPYRGHRPRRRRIGGCHRSRVVQRRCDGHGC